MFITFRQQGNTGRNILSGFPKCATGGFLRRVSLARGSATLNASLSRILWLLSCRDKKVTPPSGESRNIHSTYVKYELLSKTDIYKLQFKGALE